MIVLYGNPCYNEVCYKVTAPFGDFSVKSKAIFVTVLNSVNNVVRFSLWDSHRIPCGHFSII